MKKAKKILSIGKTDSIHYTSNGHYVVKNQSGKRKTAYRALPRNAVECKRALRRLDIQQRKLENERIALRNDMIALKQRP